MEQYNVTGMSCAACAARVEKAVNGVEGVTSCSVSLLTNSMGVEGTASPAAIIAAVEKAGYGATKKGEAKAAPSADEDALKDRETPVLKKRLIDWSAQGIVSVEDAKRALETAPKPQLSGRKKKDYGFGNYQQNPVRMEDLKDIIVDLNEDL